MVQGFMIGLNVQSLIILWLATVILYGAETNAPVRSLGGGLFRVGLVTIDSSNRTVRFLAAVQLREETIEYTVVHKTGKTHESIFRTEALPQDVQGAMLLRGASGFTMARISPKARSPRNAMARSFRFTSILMRWRTIRDREGRMMICIARTLRNCRRWAHRWKSPFDWKSAE